MVRAEREAFEQQQREYEQEAEIQWRLVIERSQEEQRKKHEQEEAAERAHKEKRTSEEQRELAAQWRQAKANREQEGKDVKPTLDSLHSSCNETIDTSSQREAEAAEAFIREIMKIRGQSKTDVLRDVVLITLEVVDQEIASQKQGTKRKASSFHNDPARLPALVTELFTKLETAEDANEKFRFSKKRKVI